MKGFCLMGTIASDTLQKTRESLILGSCLCFQRLSRQPFQQLGVSPHLPDSQHNLKIQERQGRARKEEAVASLSSCSWGRSLDSWTQTRGVWQHWEYQVWTSWKRMRTEGHLLHRLIQWLHELRNNTVGTCPLYRWQNQDLAHKKCPRFYISYQGHPVL